MAYETLKKHIEDTIFTNTERKVSGDTVQQGITDVIDALSANRTFAGVATSSTTPVLTDASVFYVTGTAGVYSGFGNLTVADGEIAVFTNVADVWSKQTVYASSVFNISNLLQTFTKDTAINSNFEKYVVDAYYQSAFEYNFSIVKVDKTNGYIQIVSNGAYTNSDTIDFDAVLSDGIYTINTKFSNGVKLYIKLNYFETSALGAFGNTFIKRLTETVYDNALYKFFDLTTNFDSSILNVLKSLSLESSTGNYYGLRYLNTAKVYDSTPIAIFTIHSSADLSSDSKITEFTIKGEHFSPYGDVEVADVATDNTYKGVRIKISLNRTNEGTINFRGNVLKVSQNCITYVESPYTYAGLGSSVSTYSWHNRSVNQANMMQYLYGVGGATFYTQVGSSYNTGTVAGTPSNVIMNQVARLFQSDVTPDVISLLSGLNDITIETGGNLENVIKNFGNTDIAFSITEALESIVASEGIDNAPKNWFSYIASLPDEDARYAYRCTASSLYAIIYFLTVKYPKATILGIIPAQNVYADAMLDVMYNVESSVYKALSISRVDMYTELGWSKHTTSLELYTSDGTHPNADGLAVLQRYYERVLRSKFR